MGFLNTDIQSSLPGMCLIEAAVAQMATSGAEARGAVFTRREVVDFILDLAGYTADKPLHLTRLLEPSMGQGDFLTPVIERLLEAYQREVGERGDVVQDLGDCILAVELHRVSYDQTCDLVAGVLRGKGLTAAQSNVLCKRWLRQGDFLLLPLKADFTHVIGNPPYVGRKAHPRKTAR
jgi:hypothetical protein